MGGIVFPTDFVEYVEQQSGQEWNEDLAQAILRGLAATPGGLSVCARVVMQQFMVFIEELRQKPAEYPEPPSGLLMFRKPEPAHAVDTSTAKPAVAAASDRDSGPLYPPVFLDLHGGHHAW